eukprot:gene3265-5708_t
MEEIQELKEQLEKMKKAEEKFKKKTKKKIKKIEDYEVLIEKSFKKHGNLNIKEVNEYLNLLEKEYIEYTELTSIYDSSAKERSIKYRNILEKYKFDEENEHNATKSIKTKLKNSVSKMKVFFSLKKENSMDLCKFIRDSI